MRQLRPRIEEHSSCSGNRSRLRVGEPGRGGSEYPIKLRQAPHDYSHALLFNSSSEIAESCCKPVNDYSDMMRLAFHRRPAPHTFPHGHHGHCKHALRVRPPMNPAPFLEDLPCVFDSDSELDIEFASQLPEASTVCQLHQAIGTSDLADSQCSAMHPSHQDEIHDIKHTSLCKRWYCFFLILFFEE